MEFFAKYKKLGFTFVSVLVVFYAIFLFVIPNCVNLNVFKKDIQKIVLDTARLNFDFESLKIVTTPSLNVGVRVKGVKLSYLSNIEIFSVNDAEAKISLLPLLTKTVRISDITVNKPKASFVYTKDGQIDFLKYLLNIFEQQQTTTETATAELPVKISPKLPKVVVKDYSLILTDEKTQNKIALNGEKFVLDDAIVNKHLRIFSNGGIFINDVENIKYDLKFSSFWPVVQSSSTQVQQPVEMPYVDFINEIVKFNPTAQILADMKITENTGNILLNGVINVDGVSVVLDGTKLPESYLHLQSKGKSTVVTSDLYLNNDEKASINANFLHGKIFKADLNFKTEKITFDGVQKFLAALMNSFHIKNDIDVFKTTGYITADFAVKTDMKKFESSGYFKISDGSIAHKLVPVRINKILADIDFSDNGLNIKTAQANVNDTMLSAKGKIDSKANADISITSGKMNIAPIFNAFAPAELKEAFVLQSGILGIDAIFKGNLAEIEPDISIMLNNFILKDKLNTFLLSDNSATLNIKAKGMSFGGEAVVSNANFRMYNPALKLSLPSAKIQITPENITIVPFDILMNSSKINVSGVIKNYMKKPDIAVVANGSVNALDLQNLLPKDFCSFVAAKGSIPVKTMISGNDKKIDINAQAYTNANNHFAPLTIKKMVGNSGLVNVALSYVNDNIVLSDIALYQSARAEFKDDFAYNKKSATKIAGLSGSVSSLSSSRPTMKIVFSIPEQIVVSNAGLPNSSLRTKGDVTISGLLTSPMFKGFFSVKDINIPDLLTKVQDVDVELNENLLAVKAQNLDVGGTAMNIDAQASTIFSNVFLIKSMKLTSDNFDVDNLFRAMDKMMAMMPTTTPAQTVGKTPAQVLPVKISNGTIDIQKLKMKQIGGDLIATNITGDFTLVNDLFKLNNLKTSVYNGTVAGDVAYHLGTTAVTADVKGKGVNANSVVTVFVALKDQLMSSVDFNVNVKLKGVTYEEQMKTLNGVVDFSMKDGQLGSLGRFETFLKADNLLSQNFISSHIGSLVNTVAPYNTGKFSYFNGDLKIVNGVAKLNSIKMSGPHMSLLITGDVNVLSMDSDMSVLGSLSPEVNSALGVISDLSVEKFAAYIPKFGTKIAGAMSSYNASMKAKELAKIPSLTPAKENTKSFKVVIDGNLNNPPAAIKKFQWLNTPEKLQAEQKSLEEAVAKTTQTTTPITKEAVKEQITTAVKNKIESNEKVQEIKENKTVKTLSGIYNFYKNAQSTTKESGENTNR